MRHDIEVAKRFAQFRLQFIAKNQEEAAKILDIGQATVSRLEQGTTPMSVAVLAILVKHYYLNIDWLLTGKGKMQDKVEVKNTTVTDITAIKGDMQLILKQLKMLQANYTYTVNKMNDRIAGLEKQLQDQRERV